MHGKEVCKGMEWIHVAKSRDVVGSCKHVFGISGFIEYRAFIDSFTRSWLVGDVATGILICRSPLQAVRHNVLKVSISQKSSDVEPDS